MRHKAYRIDFKRSLDRQKCNVWSEIFWKKLFNFTIGEQLYLLNFTRKKKLSLQEGEDLQENKKKYLGHSCK